MRKLLLAAALALLSLPAQAQNSFEFRRPSNNASQGSINDSTGEMDITAGYKEGGSNTLSNSINGNAATATALAADGANCSAGQFPLGVDASGAVQSCSTSLSGNATTATSLAANGTNCSAGFYARGVDASGNAEDCTADAGGSAQTSTFTVIPNALNTTSTELGACVSSTITLTTSASEYQVVSFRGLMSNDAANAGMKWAFLVDGAFVEGLGPTAPVFHVREPISTDSVNMHSSFIIPAGVLSAASHSFCFTFAGSGAGTARINAAGNFGGSAKAFFSVENK